MGGHRGDRQGWSTAVLLVLLMVLNAVVGLRQLGKAESAMNALKPIFRATAQVAAGRDTQRPPRPACAEGVAPGHSTAD